MQSENQANKLGQPLAVRIFIGPHGVRAGWRFLLFYALAVLLGLAGAFLFEKPLRAALSRDVMNIVGNAYVFACLYGTAWILCRMERRPLSAAGLDRFRAGRNLAAGIAVGFAALSLLMAALTLAGAYHTGPSAMHGREIPLWGAYWALMFLLVGLNEEMSTRGYPMFAFSQGIGFWPAAAIVSILFGAGHLGNRGEEWIGIANAVIVGIVFAYSVRWSGSLWWAIGAHASWDWGESFFYGVADSGALAPHHLLSGTPAGPGWLSGGSVGPEGSVMATVIILLLAVAARFTAARSPNPFLDRPKFR